MSVYYATIYFHLYELKNTIDFIMLKIILFSLFLPLSTYTYAHSGGLAPDGEKKCSKGFTSSHKEKAKSGILGKLSRLFSKTPEKTPVQKILDEINDPGLTIKTGVLARPEGGFKRYGDAHYLSWIEPNHNTNRLFIYFYLPGEKRTEKGIFALAFATYVQIKNPPPGSDVDSNRNVFKHIIYWSSQLKDVHLDEHTVGQIFEQLYGGKPEVIAQEIYNAIAFDGRLDFKLVEPLLFRNNTNKIREAVTQAIQESNATNTITTTNG